MMHRRIRHIYNSYRTIESKNEFELKIRNFISDNLSTRTTRLIQFVLFFAIIILARNFRIFIGEMKYLFFFLIAGVAATLVLLNTHKKKQRQNEYLLHRAITEIRNQNFQKALDYMLSVHENIQNDRLWTIILEFSEKYKPSETQQSRMSSEMIKNEKDIEKDDPKLFEILKQIKLVADYITKHQNIIKQSRQKIINLNQQLNKTMETKLRTEYEKLIKRYNDIIELEESKISFYNKAQKELLKLKENHILSQKLLDEKQELEGLENSLLEKSVHEAYSTDMSIDDFISYETSYLEAIKEYSETVSNSSDQNLFEDIIQKFNDKTELL